MKKWVIIIIVSAGVLLLSAYLFFPKEINSIHTTKIGCKINVVYRFILEEEKWRSWWPGEVLHDSITNKNIYEYNGYQYTVTSRKYNSILIKISNPDLEVIGGIIFLPVEDSVLTEWKYTLATNSNPINKIDLYRVTRNLDKNLTVILKSMKGFLESNLKVYGMNVSETKVPDTILVATSFSAKEYPSTLQIYKVIDSIKNYISSQNATEKNPPMLNIRQDSGRYETFIAIPVNKAIPENKDFFIVRMVAGNILVAEVRGGVYASREGVRQLRLYMKDNNLYSPAIPFESLVTNRMQETDTSKWITKIYYPVF